MYVVIVTVVHLNAMHTTAEGPHKSVVSHTLYWMMSFLGVPDHKVGFNQWTEYSGPSEEGPSEYIILY